MNANVIEAARAAFSKFEREITKSGFAREITEEITESGAANDLREALDYAPDIIEDMHSDAQSKKVAQNLINTYRRRLIEEISAELNDTGSFEVHYYLRWMSLAMAFEEARYDEDKKLHQLVLRLLKKAVKTLSKADQSDLLRALNEE